MGGPEAARAQAEDTVSIWRTFFGNCLHRSIDAAELTQALKQLAEKYPLHGSGVAKAIIGLGSSNTSGPSPRIASYVELLLRHNLTGPRNLLLALLKQSPYVNTGDEKPVESKIAGLPSLEELVFNVLASAHRNSSVESQHWRNSQAVSALGKWLQSVADRESSRQVEFGPLHTVDSATVATYEALGRLTLVVFYDPAFRKVQEASWWKKTRASIVTRTENFSMNVLNAVQSQLTPQLSAVTRCPPFVETGEDGLPVFTAQHVQNAIADLPVTNSRAGLYVWLNACLCARPQTDDMALLGYLQARYSGDLQSLIVDLLIASFDNLANSMLRHESRPQVKLVRSFICNKLPLFFVGLSGSMIPPFTVENCIQMAFTAINMNPVPPMTRDSTGVKDQLQLTRLEFLQACHLHQLISEPAISAVLGEPPLALPRVTRLTKEGLLAQCNNNTTKLESLIEDLDGMQGNCGAIATCVVESINNMYSNKDTMSLKAVCHALIRKPANLDVLVQYAQPASFLLPLCNLLNEWVHDQDQSEFQPPYEEFASVLLLISVVTHRYDLRKEDIGLTGSDGFVAQVLDNGTSSIPKDALTDEQNKQLAKWIEGLYSTDEHGETAGIGDEVMSQCPPQAFYMLVPTLFDQSVEACKSKMLAISTLKGGLEFLLEPFLLPSLIGGLSWLVEHSLEDHADADILLQILDKLLKPSSSSQETLAMHKAVLGIVGKPLYRSLGELARRRPEKKEPAEGLMALLKPHTSQQRALSCTRAELESWASTPHGGLAQCVRSHVRDLTLWASASGVNAPPEYSHGMISVASRALGAATVLRALVTELSEQTAMGSGSIALDVCISIVSAPVLESPSQPDAYSNNPLSSSGVRLNLRDAIRLEMLDLARVLSKPVEQAQALVRLSRRVEAQLAPPQMPQMAMPMAIAGQSTDQMMQDLGLTNADVNAANVGTSAPTNPEGDAMMQTSEAPDFSSQDVANMMDLDNVSGQDFANMTADAGSVQMNQQEQNIFGDLSFDMTDPPQQMDASASLVGGNGAENAGGQQQSQDPNQEEDIFAGLDMGGMDDFGGDFNFS
ncbi:hypothetical protein MBLNU230_g5683t1 [Neophaeotheca triangularis]